MYLKFVFFSADKINKSTQGFVQKLHITYYEKKTVNTLRATHIKI